MNEPSVFDSEELTLPRDVLHKVTLPSEVGSADAAIEMDVEHRIVHIVYGALQAAATHEGLLKRSDNAERPFLLSRSFFVGSQRHGAVWTGDNTASWEHLRVSFSMILTLSLSGIPFTGADVGGFFGQPSNELLTRWYQSAAYLPFFRGHAHVDEARREPYLLPSPYREIAIEAIRERQRLLPYWATLWYVAAHGPDGLGAPIVSPPWVHFPPSKASAIAATRSALRAEGQWMVGDALLVQPVASPGLKSVTVQLPGDSNELWYPTWAEASPGVLTAGIKLGKSTELHTKPKHGGTEVSIPTPLAVTPTLQRGGTILPRRERVRRSALLAIHDPITLHVAPNTVNGANGMLFLDDGVSTPGAKDAADATKIVLTFGCVEGKATCELSASAECLWGACTKAKAKPHDVHVDAVLIRGMSLHAPAANATAVEAPRAEFVDVQQFVMGGAGPIEVNARQTARGLLFSGLKASLRPGVTWTLRLKGWAL